MLEIHHWGRGWYRQGRALGGVIIMNWEPLEDVCKVTVALMRCLLCVQLSSKHFTFENLPNPPTTLWERCSQYPHVIEEAEAQTLEALAQLIHWPEPSLLTSMHTTITKCLPKHRASFPHRPSPKIQHALRPGLHLSASWPLSADQPFINLPWLCNSCKLPFRPVTNDPAS